MNREQRRKKAKGGVTSKDLKEIYDTTKATSIHKTISIYSVAVASVLHDKWGFGEVRLKRILAQIQEQFDSITNGYVRVEDLKKMLLEETKIDFREDSKPMDETDVALEEAKVQEAIRAWKKQLEEGSNVQTKR